MTSFFRDGTPDKRDQPLFLSPQYLPFQCHPPAIPIPDYLGNHQRYTPEKRFFTKLKKYNADDADWADLRRKNRDSGQTLPEKIRVKPAQSDVFPRSMLWLIVPKKEDNSRSEDAIFWQRNAFAGEQIHSLAHEMKFPLRKLVFLSGKSLLQKNEGIFRAEDTIFWRRNAFAGEQIHSFAHEMKFPLRKLVFLGGKSLLQKNECIFRAEDTIFWQRNAFAGEQIHSLAHEMKFPLRKLVFLGGKSLLQKNESIFRAEDTISWQRNAFAGEQIHSLAHEMKSPLRKSVPLSGRSLL